MISGGKEYLWMLCSKHSLHQIFVSYLDFHLNWNYHIARKNWLLWVTHANLSLSFKCVLTTSILIDSVLHESAGAAEPVLIEEDFAEVTVQKTL